MEILNNILNFIVTNPLITGVIGVFFGSVGFQIFKFVWEKWLQKIAYDNIEKLGYDSGTWIGKKLNKIKDKNIRKLAYEEIRETPDKFDVGFDKGLDSIISL